MSGAAAAIIWPIIKSFLRVAATIQFFPCQAGAIHYRFDAPVFIRLLHLWARRDFAVARDELRSTGIAVGKFLSI
jgi:hypothetical protein